MAGSKVWYNGTLLSESEARVPVDDGGWLHGAGLFETMRAEHGAVFRFQRHLDRLCASAEKLLRPIDPRQLPTADDGRALLRANGLAQARLRLTVSAGSMRGDGDDPALPFNVALTAVALTEYPASLYETGITVVISAYRQNPRDPIAGHKTTCYLPRLLALREAQRARCVEALWFTNQNLLAEGSVSNIFLVQNGSIVTPPLDTPVLPGIARETVLERARSIGIEAEERALTVNDLLDADEVFLTNAIMQVMPVTHVERHDIKDARVGPVTKKLSAAYRDLVENECQNV